MRKSRRTASSRLRVEGCNTIGQDGRGLEEQSDGRSEDRLSENEEGKDGNSNATGESDGMTLAADGCSS